MANPFQTSTQYITDTNSSSKIKYTTDPNAVLLLNPGELGFNFASGTLQVGTINPALPPKIIIDQNNSFINYLTSDLNTTVTNKVPTSATVRRELDKKADLTHSNQFTGMNEFPYLRVNDAAPSQENIAVTIKMLRDYLDGVSKDIKTTIAAGGNTSGVDGAAKVTKRFIFPEPIEMWDVQHDMHTRIVTMTIVDLLGNQQVAPYKHITDNRLQIYFSEPVAGEVTIVFN